MAYSYAARGIFHFARKNGWRTVLRNRSRPFRRRVVAKLYEASDLFKGQFKRPPAEYWSKWRDECDLADRIVVNSLWSQEALISEGIPSQKISVIPLAHEEVAPSISFRRDYPAAFTAERPLRVLFLGQINLRKGIEPLLDAVRLLTGEPIEFWFVGPLQVSIANIALHRQIRWTGSVPRGDAAKYYQNADIFIFPTFSDGFGLTQLEAQAWNLPIVSSRFCGTVVKEGRNGLLLPEVSASTIAAVLRKLLAEPACLRALSDNSQHAERDFSCTIALVGSG